MSVQLRREEFSEGAQIIRARARGQVIHPIDLAALVRDLRSHNHGRRRRAEKRLVKAAKRGIVGRARS